MGMPARRIEADPFAYRSNHLRLVTTPPVAEPSRTRTGTKTRTSSGVVKTKRAPRAHTAPALSASMRASLRREEARSRTAFWAFVGVLVFAVALGGARVTLIVRAAEATVTESRVQAAIKTQRAVADQLEVDKSTLSAPSRIAGIASATMDMGEPASVRYISLQGGVVSAAGTEASMASAASPDVLGRLLGAAVDLSAGEAQSLLVGDLGLAGSR